MSQRAGSRRGVTTIADVARSAGVSLATVSRVMNGRQTVDATLADRVRAAATELGYAPSPLARGLVNGRTDTVALIVPDLGNPSFHGVLHGLSGAALDDGFRVLVADSREKVADEPVLARDLRRRSDAIVLCSPRSESSVVAGLLEELAPAVVVNRRDLDQDVANVVNATDHCAELVLEHLHSLGHRRVLYLSGREVSASNAARLDGIAQFRRVHPEVEVEVRFGGTTLADGWAACDVVLGADVTAVMVFNDMTALGLLAALAERGVPVPERLSVAGVDDVPYAAYSHPPLTTVVTDPSAVGAQAWWELGLASSDGRERPRRVDARLVVRRSTGPAPA